jgi:hypothetical protein
VREKLSCEEYVCRDVSTFTLERDSLKINV